VKGVSAARNVIAKGCLDLAVQQLELARSECSKRVPDFDEMIAAAKKSKDNAVESANAFDDQMRDELLRLTHEQDLLKLCVYRDKATEKKMEAEVKSTVASLLACSKPACRTAATALTFMRRISVRMRLMIGNNGPPEISTGSRREYALEDTWFTVA
jgi:hypothetical protein